MLKSAVATLATIAFATGITAATASATPASPHANCSSSEHTGRFSQMWVCTNNGKMIEMQANDFLSPDIEGHWEFRGPSGHLSNSANTWWKPGDIYSLDNINQSAPPGSLWCVEFWVRADDGSWQGMENPMNCYTI